MSYQPDVVVEVVMNLKRKILFGEKQSNERTKPKRERGEGEDRQLPE
jgi:hypothetical protein